MNETVYDIRLSLAIGPNSAAYGLLKNFENAEEIYKASDNDLILSGIPEKLFCKLTDRDLSQAYRVAEFCSRYAVNVLVYGKPGYPEKLYDIPCPPYLLYVLGELPDFVKNPGIGVVGTRHMTEYGMKNAYKISYELASAGLTVVSGMARGIDGTSAAAALEAGKKTVAVIGAGLDTAYPPEHRQLMKEIAKNGAVVSEFAPSSPPSSSHFPIRNRIISGLSEGLFVVEADKKSGAMLTAEDARVQGREIFALPGRIGDSNSEGPLSLLSAGAHAVVSTGDILSVYADKFPGCVNEDAYARSVSLSDFRPANLGKHGVRCSDGHIPDYRSEIEKPSPSDAGLYPEDGLMRTLFEKMPKGRAVSPDYFVGHGFGIADAVNLLSLLEITGFVRSVPGGMYIR